MDPNEFLWPVERANIHFYKMNGNFNSTIQKNIINDHKCKTVFFAI